MSWITRVRNSLSFAKKRETPEDLWRSKQQADLALKMRGFTGASLGRDYFPAVLSLDAFNTDRIDHLYQDPHVDNQRFTLHYGDLTDGSRLVTLLEKVQRVCRPFLDDPYAQRHHFWMNYAERHRAAP